MNKFLQQKSNNQRSVRTIKLCSALCLGLGLIIVSTFSSYYWELYQRAHLLNEQDTGSSPSSNQQGPPQSSGFILVPAADAPQYDNCGVAKPVDPDAVWFNTNWSFVFRFNAIFYTVVTGMVICSCTGLIYTRIFNPMLSCLLLAAVVHMAAIILAGVYRYNQNGKDCAEVDTEYDDLGNSYQSDAVTY